MNPKDRVIAKTEFRQELGSRVGVVGDVILDGLYFRFEDAPMLGAINDTVKYELACVHDEAESECFLCRNAVAGTYDEDFSVSAQR
ncbi:MAG: hypothetical protein A3I07_03680 [Candidatus Doudnabacteria bacterium RIFCSPLOWO2_02_FULL_42_9]|uniref:Uncharacterized protein n=1 Tax=Candidatus Doudnabacteria bacterium RIFCSPHIGHO2_01_FULL_41_86 TaxID=1817821 RepID=A0A1F5N9V9_9BACT|nr:MAG: hypothetical protein A2717_02350 [Candidatus Doudnabacteria bacterium RIFCSPHIGHO2_01_FULL_41_86]OGE75602.1 MAG: hypothetical protein A3K07_02110 [Candidatus Doudnabacteria bacterium RIFCSPHIGHO2_01_43_10]OGE85397.1 MAG: hypothetical protein A3E28_01920 [Candidatus Doudnabacteria bacterium RIFCSPHIGHO2_12_FULL_42_22]OGE86935.1 MAG: hypothetical protein A3C49_02755 [Candidatus Doudnabacteria bacterium RIFCSPHIGHO2_02_FULL_42_25]OGE92534.1 MAG: hypothetical protein A2895_02910 [Candidatus